MKKVISIIVASILSLVLLYGCTQPPPSQETPNQPTQNVITTGQTGLGTVMMGTNGMTLYVWQKDSNGQSACYGQCAQFWPPLTIPANTTPTGTGITATLGVTERTDGTFQVTANGMPLYYFSGDKVSGDINGQGSTGFGALWYVISPSGQQIMTPKPSNATNTTQTQNPAQSGSSTGSSGYG